MILVINYEVDPAVSWEFPILFLDQESSNPRSVRLKADWLQTLTFRLGNPNMDAWTSLSYMLTQIGVDNSTWFIEDWNIVGNIIEQVFSAIAVDGMSRKPLKGTGDLKTHRLVSSIWRH